MQPSAGQAVLQTGHTGRALSSELPWATGHKRLLGTCTRQREPDTKTHPPTNTRETKTALSHTPARWRRRAHTRITWPERSRHSPARRAVCGAWRLSACPASTKTPYFARPERTHHHARHSSRLSAQETLYNGLVATLPGPTAARPHCLQLSDSCMGSVTTHLPAPPGTDYWPR